MHSYILGLEGDAGDLASAAPGNAVLTERGLR
jgi:hypothetical protein